MGEGYVLVFVWKEVEELQGALAQARGLPSQSVEWCEGFGTRWRGTALGEHYTSHVSPALF